MTRMDRSSRALLRTVAALGLFALVTPTLAAAQTVVLDQGTYRIAVGGRDVGTETFTIRRSGSGTGAVIIASGRVALAAGDVRELTSQLQVSGSSLRPAAYDVTVQGDGQEKIAGRIVGGRFSAQISSTSGENMREYLVSDGAILVEEGIAHHHYFIARRIDSGTARVPIVVPRQNRQVWADVAVTGTEAIRIGGQSIEARRITVRPTDGAERVLWADDVGRVLRLEIPSQQYVAERTAPPE